MGGDLSTQKTAFQDTCASGKQPRKFTLDELKNLQIGETTQMTDGCGPLGVESDTKARLVERGFGWPNNTEFDWGGPGNDCQMCSSVPYGYGCSDCPTSVIGKRGKVKRIAFNGNTLKCCTTPNDKWWDGSGTTPLDTDKTCHPDSKNYEKTYCDATMQTYCAQGNNAGTPICGNWARISAGKGRNVATQIMDNYCSQGANFKNQACQNWVKAVQAQPTLKYDADNATLAFCRNNPTDPQCKCLSPPENITKLEEIMTTNKVCWYSPCKNLSDQYLTMKDKEVQATGCSAVVCQINSGDIDVAGSQQTKTMIENKCGPGSLKDGSGGSTPSGSTPSGSSPSDSSDNTNKPPEEESNNKTMIYVGGGAAFISYSSSMCICLIMIAVIIYFATQKPKK